MRYHVVLRKEKTYWWDEDPIGSCTFNARDDEQARSFIATVVQSMNRKYWRIDAPQNVFISSLHRVKENEFGNTYEPVSLWNCVKPFETFRDIRAALEAFYPKEDGKRIMSMMHTFANYHPLDRF